MNRSDGFDRHVSEWLHADAEHRVPEHLDAVLRRTRNERQRPAWSSLERWLPVQASLRLVPVPRLAWLLVVLALIVALGAAVLYVGSRPRVPAPFGLARNGAILYGGTDNDIHSLDPVTGATRTLITGTTGDHRPLLSPDGARLLFLRDSTTRDQGVGLLQPMIMVANGDGTDVRPLTGAIANFGGFTGNTAWSHDGSMVAVSSGVDSAPLFQVFSLDGSTKPVVIDTRGMAVAYVAFRPDDRELTFRGMTSQGDGLYAVGADGRGLRTILPATQGDGASLSPDGTKIAYQVWDGTLGVIHVIDVDSGLDSTPALDAPSNGAMVDDAPTWSPDGNRLLFIMYAATDNHLAVASATGGRRREIGPAMPNDGSGGEYQFSPDGSQVLAHYNSDGSTWLLDPAGTIASRQLPPSIAQTATWQRLAP